MIEVERGVLGFARGGLDPVAPSRPPRSAGRLLVEHDHARLGGKTRGERADHGAYVEAPGVVDVAAGGHEDLGLNLMKAREGRVHAEVGRARAENGANRRAREKEHHCFGNVRGKGRHTIASPDPFALEGCRGTRDLVAECRPAEDALASGLGDGDDGG